MSTELNLSHPHSNQNPERTARHLAEMDRRRAEIRDALTAILKPGQPFVWELGAGHGHFLTAYANAHREKVCIGIDIASDRVERSARKRERSQLPNLHFLRAEGRLFLECMPTEARFHELFILFPDPWPKARHHKHRIIQPDFLTAAAARATPDCRLFFRTDYSPYYKDARQTVAEHAAWNISDEPWPFEYETVFQSRAPSHESLVARRASK